jgi:hypothetical protein
VLISVPLKKSHIPDNVILPKQKVKQYIYILHSSENISKNESKKKKLDVFGSKFGSDTFTFIDQLLFIFWDGGSIVFTWLYIMQSLQTLCRFKAVTSIFY